MNATDVESTVERRANELYWGSDRSVNQIAEDLELSKGALYEAIRPLPAGLGCPSCGSEVVYSNRTAQERGRLECPGCGWQGPSHEAGAEIADPGGSVALTGPLPGGSSRSGEWYRVAVGGAMIGAAVGLALVFWARRRA